MPSPPLRRKIIFYLMMYLLVFACTLLLSEAVLRVSGRVGIQSVHTASEQDFQRVPGIFEPRQDLMDGHRPELDHHVSINSLGFRGPEISRTKPPGVVRILCLGDSFTYGEYVNDDESFPFYLQSIFLRNQIPVEVINGGVYGTTIVDQLVFLRKGIEIDPDIVILTFSENDIEGLGSPQPMYVSLADNRKLKSGPVIGPVYRLFRDTALFNFALLLRTKYSKLSSIQQVSAKEGGVSASTRNEQDVLWERYGEILKEMKIYLDRRLIHLVLAIFPSHYRIGTRSESEIRSPGRVERIEKLAKTIGVPTLNLLVALEKVNMGSNQLYLLPYDGHPSKVAYSIVAGSMFENLQGKVQDIRMVKAAVNARGH